MKCQEINYIVEAANEDITIYSLEVPDYKGTRMSYNAVTMVPNAKVRNIHELLEQLGWETDKLINMHETSYGSLIRTLKIKNTSAMVKTILGQTGKSFYDNSKLLELRTQLRRIKDSPRYVVETNHHSMKVSRPDFLIVETDAVTIKVPSKFQYPDASLDANWDYDYLLHPNQNMDLKSFKLNEGLLRDINSNLGMSEGDEQEIKLDILTNIDLLEGYTPNRYEVSRRRMRDISLRTKAIINVIREEETYKYTNSEYFGVYQESRMARENKSPYTEIKYSSDYSKEITFPALFREVLKVSPGQYMDIDEAELRRFSETLDGNTEEGLLKNDIKIIVDYIEMKKMKLTNQEIMAEYERSENEREMIREEIFLANLAMVGNLETLYSYLNNVYCNASLSLFDFSYNIGRELNRVKLSFSYKEVAVIDEDSLGMSLSDSRINSDDDMDFMWD